MTDTNNKTAVQIGHEDHVTHSCWSCGDMRAEYFCNACGKVQPPQPADYFSFFGLPRRLNLNLAALERELYSLSRKLHPDLFARSTQREQLWSLEQTSQLNDAYRTLKDPIERTEYLLKLEGFHLDEQSQRATEQARTTGEQKKQVVPPDLLEEVFELNMQLEELRMNRKMGDDDPDLVRELEKAKANFSSKLDNLNNELKLFWNDWDTLADRVDARTDGNVDQERNRILKGMVDVLNRRSYIRNLVRDVNAALSE